ncbi:unnamed protein product [Camellia sinensis]
METVVLISVEPRGVVQFGSTQKIPESMEFVDQTKRLFREIENGDMVFLPDNIPSSSNSEIYGMSGRLFASLISSGNSNPGNLKPINDANSKNYVGTTSSSADLPWLSPFTSDHGRTHSSHLQNQLQMATTEAPLVQSTTYCSAAPTPCISTWSSGQSTLTSFEQQLLSSMIIMRKHKKSQFTLVLMDRLGPRWIRPRPPRLPILPSMESFLQLVWFNPGNNHELLWDYGMCADTSRGAAVRLLAEGLNLLDYREHNDDTTVHFEVIMSEENLIMAQQEGLLKKFKLTTTISTSNMHLFDPKCVIKKYETPEQILEEFFHIRLEFYKKRKATLHCSHYLSQGGYSVDDFMECIQG